MTYIILDSFGINDRDLYGLGIAFRDHWTNRYTFGSESDARILVVDGDAVGAPLVVAGELERQPHRAMVIMALVNSYDDALRPEVRVVDKPMAVATLLAALDDLVDPSTPVFDAAGDGPALDAAPLENEAPTFRAPAFEGPAFEAPAFEAPTPLPETGLEQPIPLLSSPADPVVPAPVTLAPIPEAPPPDGTSERSTEPAEPPPEVVELDSEVEPELVEPQVEADESEVSAATDPVPPAPTETNGSSAPGSERIAGAGELLLQLDAGHERATAGISSTRATELYDPAQHLDGCLAALTAIAHRENRRTALVTDDNGLTYDPRSQVFASTGHFDWLNELAISGAPCAHYLVEDATTLELAEFAHQPAISVLWRAAMLSSDGRLRTGIDPTRPCGLRYWPDLTRLLPLNGMVPIVAAISARSPSITDLIDEGHQPHVVNAIVDALAAIGAIDFDTAIREAWEAKDAAPDSGLLKRLLGRRTS